MKYICLLIIVIFGYTSPLYAQKILTCSHRKVKERKNRDQKFQTTQNGKEASLFIFHNNRTLTHITKTSRVTYHVKPLKNYSKRITQVFLLTSDKGEEFLWTSYYPFMKKVVIESTRTYWQFRLVNVFYDVPVKN